MNLLLILQDLATLQEISSFNVKDLSVTLILGLFCWYSYRKTTELEAKNEVLNNKIFEIQNTCVKALIEFKEVIAENTKAIQNSGKNTGQ